VQTATGLDDPRRPTKAVAWDPILPDAVHPAGGVPAKPSLRADGSRCRRRRFGGVPLERR